MDYFEKERKKRNDATIKKMMWNNEYLLQGVVRDVCVHGRFFMHLSFSTEYSGCGKSSSINTGSRPVRETLLGSKYHQHLDTIPQLIFLFYPKIDAIAPFYQIPSIAIAATNPSYTRLQCKSNPFFYLDAYRKPAYGMHSIWHCLAD